MNMKRNIHILLAFGFLSLARCASSHETVSDGQSHFLTSCEAVCEGDLSCICGVCTRACKTKSACDDLSGDAVCLSLGDLADERQCETADPAVESVCEMQCEGNGDCKTLGQGFTCQAGFCRDEGYTEPGQTNGPDAGTSDGTGGASCRWPESLDLLSDGGVAEAPGCYVARTGESCGPEGCQSTCASYEYMLSCYGDVSMPGSIPEPESSLGCAIVPIPTPENVLFYCCPCLNGVQKDGGTDGAADLQDGGAGAGTGGDPGPVFYGPFDVGTDPNANCVQAGQICHRLTTIQCAGEVHCCENPGRTFQECYDYMFDGCVNELYIDKISLDPIVGFDLDFACTAFAEYEQKTEQCDPSVVDWGISMDGLRGIIKGTRGPGEGCATDITPPTKEGEAAALVSCTDGANQACLPTAVAFWNCRPLNGEGGNCMTDINCLPDLYCDNPDLSVTGARCKNRKQIGEPCAAANECLTLVCKQGQCRLDDQQGVFCLRND
jgi:hypothetical protein